MYASAFGLHWFFIATVIPTSFYALHNSSIYHKHAIMYPSELWREAEMQQKGLQMKKDQWKLFGSL